jgi:hypothetical protein
MIGDHLSLATNKKLKLWGTIGVIGFYLLCVTQARQWAFYSVVCGPLVMVTWIWGLGVYKIPREAGRFQNFGMPAGLSMGRVTEIAGFQRGNLIDLDELIRPDPHPGGETPGGRTIEYHAVKTIKLSRPTLPPIRVSRYAKVLDKAKWVV